MRLRTLAPIALALARRAQRMRWRRRREQRRRTRLPRPRLRRASRSRSGSATSPTSPTRPRSSASRAASSKTLGRQRDARAVDVQRRARGRRSHLRRRARRVVHRPEPGDQRVRAVERRSDPDRLRCCVRRRVPRRQATRSTVAEDLTGKTLATPQLGNTQDVALRAWLKEQGYETDTAGGGDVSVLPQDNSQTLDTVQERRHRRRMGARAVGDAPRQRGRRQGPRRRARPLAGRQVRHHASDRAHRVPRRPPRRREATHRGRRRHRSTSSRTTPTEAKTLREHGDRERSPASRSRPNSSTPRSRTSRSRSTRSRRRWPTSATNAEELGLLDPADLDGIYDLTLLNEVLDARGEPAVSDT